MAAADDKTLNMPRHVAVIMDGNGRWAQARGLPRSAGHKAGAESVRRILNACTEFGIPYLTLYAFSTENWKRPKAEVDTLMTLLCDFLKAREKDLHRNKTRLLAIGQIERLPEKSRTILAKVIAATANYTERTLVLALSYGSRDEMVRAVRKLAQEVKAGALDPEAITEETVSGALMTAGIPDPDLLIRTSGEMRLSNFLLWQLSYAEIVVTPCMWPDFDRDEFRKALEEYGRRRRRFGGIQHA
jgi:undecaprenyl diphosphate synthase